MIKQLSMSPAKRLRVVFNGKIPDRVPVMPKIWFNLAARLCNVDLKQIIEGPAVAMHSVVDAAVSTGSDGVRLFLYPARRTIQKEGRFLEIGENGSILGTIDLAGGLATQLNDVNSFSLENTHQTAFHTCWGGHEPIVGDISDVRRMAVPDKEFYEQTGYGDIVRDVQGKVKDRIGLAGDCDSATLAFCVSFRGMMQALTDIIDSPQLVHALMEKGTEFAIERGKFFIDLGVKILRLNDSVGNMSVISPESWREFIFPHMKNVCDTLHSYSKDSRIYCHICGNILPILDDLLDAGLDCLAPLDPLGGFSVLDVRNHVGDDVVLMGGVNTLSFTNATYADVRAEAQKCIEQGNRNGKYILGSGCVVPPTAKRENIEALVHEAKEYTVA